MNEKKENILILGGGQTACYAASEIRKYNTKSIISIISNERQLPYERPPLSKDCLLNKMEYDDCSFFNRDFYAKNEINFYSEELVEGVDFKSQKIDTSKRKKISYDKLLIALGSE